MTDYNYEIERTFAKYGGEADKGVGRTCGNCESYIKEHWACGCADAEDSDFHKATDAGCYYHRTHAEQKLLKHIIDERCRLAEQKRIEDNRRDGTGECKGCPYRKKGNEPTTNFKRITRSPLVLAKIVSRNVLKPLRCRFCTMPSIYSEHCPVEEWEYDDCDKHIKEWLEKEAK